MRTLKNSLLLVVAMEEIKIGNKNSETTKKCPMCGKPMVRELTIIDLYSGTKIQTKKITKKHMGLFIANVIQNTD